MSTTRSIPRGIDAEQCSASSGAMHATNATDATNERVQDQGGSSSVPEHTTRAVDNSPRVKVACINWGHEGAPKAMSYVLWYDGELVADRYHDTWDEAMARANGLALSLRRMVVAA